MNSLPRRQSKGKGRNNDLPGGGYSAWPHACGEHWNFRRLSPYAKALLFDLLSFYRGNNNGDLSCAHSLLKCRNWRSRSTIEKYRDELERAGWIVRTRQGGKNATNLFALSFRNVDECKGKLDAHVRIGFKYDYWKTGENPDYVSSKDALDDAA